MENPLKTMALNPLDPEMKVPVLYATDVKDIVNTFMLKESSKKFINELEKNYVIINFTTICLAFSPHKSFFLLLWELLRSILLATFKYALEYHCAILYKPSLIYFIMGILHLKQTTFDHMTA